MIKSRYNYLQINVNAKKFISEENFQLKDLAFELLIEKQFCTKFHKTLEYSQCICTVGVLFRKKSLILTQKKCDIL